MLRLQNAVVKFFVTTIVWKEFEADKLSILDILAIDNADRRLNVEVQRTKPTCLPQRKRIHVSRESGSRTPSSVGY